MWKDYIKERENLETLETEHGFLTYEIYDDICFMSDIYIKPEFRNTKAAFKLFSAVKEEAVSQGCVFIRGQVDSSCIGWEKSLSYMKRLGFREFHIDNNLTYLQLKLYNVRGI